MDDHKLRSVDGTSLPLSLVSSSSSSTRPDVLIKAKRRISKTNVAVDLSLSQSDEACRITEDMRSVPQGEVKSTSSLSQSDEACLKTEDLRSVPQEEVKSASSSLAVGHKSASFPPSSSSSTNTSSNILNSCVAVPSFQAGAFVPGGPQLPPCPPSKHVSGSHLRGNASDALLMRLVDLNLGDEALSLVVQLVDALKLEHEAEISKLSATFFDGRYVYVI